MTYRQSQGLQDGDKRKVRPTSFFIHLSHGLQGTQQTQTNPFMRKFLFLAIFTLIAVSAKAFYYNDLEYYPLYSTSDEVPCCELRGYDPNLIIPPSVKLIIPDYVYYNNVKYKVIRISNGAFKGAVEIEEIVVPYSVEEIGAEAFKSCINLKECILYPKVKKIGNQAFSGCLSLTVLNTCAEEIGIEAFSYCTSLSLVYLGAPMKYIEPGAFMGCTLLTNIDIPFTVERIGDGIGYLNHTGVFENCLMLKLVTFSFNLSDKLPNLKVVGTNTFKNCINLEKLDFPYSTTTIRQDAFMRCTSLKHLEWGGPEKLQISDIDFTGVTLSRIVFHGNINSYADFGSLEFLKEVRFDKYATEIPSNLFKNNGSLMTVHLDHITKIQSQAFRNCTSLKYLTLSPELEEIEYSAFQNCNSLETLNIPDNVNSIGSYAFAGCKKLNNVTLGKNITKIDGCAFKGCYSLPEIEFPVLLTDFTPNAIDSCINLKHVTIGGLSELRIGNYFGQNTAIESIELKGNLKGEFRNLETLKSIKFSDYADKASSQLFQHCTNLTTVDFNKIKTIESYAFNGCTKLIDCDLSKIEEIGSYAFYGCQSLITADLSSATKIESGAFGKCTSLQAVKLGNNISTIYSGTFDGTGITTLTIPDNITEFSYLPQQCENLKSIYIGNGIEKILNGFYNCPSLEDIWIGKNVNIFRPYIPENVKSITSANPIPPTTSNIFPREVCKNAVLTVPIGSIQAYRGANYWMEFYNIKEADLTGVENILTDEGTTEIKIVNGMIEISSGNKIFIYNIDGQLIYQLSAGSHSLSLSSGNTYIIQSGKTVKKVVL